MLYSPNHAHGHAVLQTSHRSDSLFVDRYENVDPSMQKQRAETSEKIDYIENHEQDLQSDIKANLIHQSNLRVEVSPGACSRIPLIRQLTQIGGHVERGDSAHNSGR